MAAAAWQWRLSVLAIGSLAIGKLKKQTAKNQQATAEVGLNRREQSTKELQKGPCKELSQSTWK